MSDKRLDDILQIILNHQQRSHTSAGLNLNYTSDSGINRMMSTYRIQNWKKKTCENVHVLCICAHLAGAYLSVYVGLLTYTVLQVWDLGL